MMDKKLITELTKTLSAKTKLEAQISNAIAEFQEEASTIREREAELNDAIKLGMEKAGIPKFENDIIRITYISPTVRNAIDVGRLKEELPEVATEYMKQSTVKSSIRIKVKETI